MAGVAALWPARVFWSLRAEHALTLAPDLVRAWLRRGPIGPARAAGARPIADPLGVIAAAPDLASAGFLPLYDLPDGLLAVGARGALSGAPCFLGAALGAAEGVLAPSFTALENALEAAPAVLLSDALAAASQDPSYGRAGFEFGWAPVIRDAAMLAAADAALGALDAATAEPARATLGLINAASARMAEDLLAAASPLTRERAALRLGRLGDRAAAAALRAVAASARGGLGLAPDAEAAAAALSWMGLDEPRGGPKRALRRRGERR